MTDRPYIQRLYLNMIGRLARENTLAEVGVWNVTKVAAAATCIVGALASKYLATADSYVIVFSLASLCFSGFPIVWHAFQGLLRLKTNVDELVSIAIMASVFLGEWISAAIVAFIMVLGGLLEEYTSVRARRHIESLVGANPTDARVIDESGEIRIIPITDLRPGYCVLTRPGDVVPADGTVIEGASDVDESMLTGESVPACKSCGNRVFAGTINCEGALQIRVERTGNDTTQGKIVRLVMEAEQHHAPILRVAEAYARWFTPAILTLGVLVWVVTGDVHRAVTMLIVGCPCAFVLATPTAVIAALGRASKCGVLVKGGKYLEACAQVNAIAFDKTGTLTSGRYRLSEVIPLSGRPPEELLFHAARLESSAEHPIARAIAEEAKARGIAIPEVANIQRAAGLGVSEISAPDADGIWRCGNARFMEQHQIPVADEARTRADLACAEGRTTLYLARGAQLQGMLVLEDEVRPETREVLKRLEDDGYGNILVLTGDHAAVAHRVADGLGIPRERVKTELLPEDKYRQLQGFEDAGTHICYVGDGTNDGPALAAASVGISIGSRENTVALETADIILMQNGLASLPFLLRLAKKTQRTIRQNILFFGLAYNALMLCLSAGGILTPILGALGHNLGSVAVVLNSALLLRLRQDEQ